MCHDCSAGWGYTWTEGQTFWGQFGRFLPVLASGSVTILAWGLHIEENRMLPLYPSLYLPPDDRLQPQARWVLQRESYHRCATRHLQELREEQLQRLSIIRELSLAMLYDDLFTGVLYTTYMLYTWAPQLKYCPTKLSADHYEQPPKEDPQPPLPIQPQRAFLRLQNIHGLWVWGGG